jgi:hypothetical protein
LYIILLKCIHRIYPLCISLLICIDLCLYFTVFCICQHALRVFCFVICILSCIVYPCVFATCIAWCSAIRSPCHALCVVICLPHVSETIWFRSNAARSGLGFRPATTYRKSETIRYQLPSVRTNCNGSGSCQYYDYLNPSRSEGDMIYFHHFQLSSELL